MARQVHDRDISRTLAAGESWIKTCLIEDRSILSQTNLWTLHLTDEVYHAFVDHPDYGPDDFMTKLTRQIAPASPAAHQLLAEMLWALLLFPSNMKARSKRAQISELWAAAGQQLSEALPMLANDVLAGIGSGGPAFFYQTPG